MGGCEFRSRPLLLFRRTERSYGGAVVAGFRKRKKPMIDATDLASTWETFFEASHEPSFVIVKVERRNSYEMLDHLDVSDLGKVPAYLTTATADERLVRFLALPMVRFRLLSDHTNEYAILRSIHADHVGYGPFHPNPHRYFIVDHDLLPTGISLPTGDFFLIGPPSSADPSVPEKGQKTSVLQWRYEVEDNGYGEPGLIIGADVFTDLSTVEPFVNLVRTLRSVGEPIERYMDWLMHEQPESPDEYDIHDAAPITRRLPNLSADSTDQLGR
jgi:hypothetical protein